MRPFFPVIFSTITILILSAVEILLLRALHRDWWKHAWVRRVSWGVPLTGIVFLSLWTLGILGGLEWLVAVGASVSAAVFVTGVALMLSLPFSAIMHTVDRVLRWLRTRRKAESVPDPMRRRVLTTSAAVFPVLAVAAGAKGLANGYAEPRFPVVPLRYPALPPALEGLRILHISDVHVGFFIGLDDLERMAERAAALRPDLVLITGDFSDDAASYLDALRLAAAIPSRYGAYASIGNHEYFRGIESIVRSYERGPIPLLRDTGSEIRIGEASLYLAGLDDPQMISRMSPNFFDRTLERALKDQPSEAFTIALSHRPMGFDVAAPNGVQLTLAGHTHGGQIGFNGRSLLYALNPEKYMWGVYEKGDAKLYVSAGAGHWFPYRIGCPAEIPLYVLRRNSNEAG